MGWRVLSLRSDFRAGLGTREFTSVSSEAECFVVVAWRGRTVALSWAIPPEWLQTPCQQALLGRPVLQGAAKVSVRPWEVARKPVIPAGHRLLEKSWEVLGH